MKRIGLIFGMLLLLLASGFNIMGQQKIRKVVIDAGHGGKDPGAVSKNAYEKDIVLKIALKTGEYIEKYLPDVEVIYTRKRDVFVELHKRAEIANKSKADLFISIHCNANRSPAPYGTETYVMGLHKSQANLEVAKKENAAILKEENYADMYEGFDPNKDEDYITLTLFQNAYLEQSTIIASLIQDQFRERVKLKDRGVMQAGFLVLYRIAMPGILVETGYLSNPRDERYLMSEKGQVYIASAIYRAFKEYKQQMEQTNGETFNLIADNNPEPVKIEEHEDEIVFKVQFATSVKPEMDKYSDLQGVEEYFHSGIYKYTVGNEKNLDDAINLQNKLRRNGKYKDAFVVAFINGDRVSVKEATQRLNN